MADSILRLKVDSQEYDNKIKRAAEGIKRYADGCRAAGGTLEFLDEGVLEFVKSLGKMDTVMNSTRGQVREMSQALTDLTTTYRSLSDEEKSSPFGQELAKSIEALTERAGQAQDAMSDVQASIKNAASDTRTFDQMAQGAQVLTAGFQGLTGTAELLGINIGDDVQVIAQLQSAMAVTNSLATIQTALQKESALMMGVVAVQTKAAAIAQELLAKNTALATAAGKAFNLVAKANPIGLVATAAIAAGTALFALGKKEDEQVDKLKEAEKAAEEYKKELDDLANKTAGNLYEKLVTLQASWEKLETNGEKTQWIKENSNAFKELGISISSIKDAEDILINNTSAIVEAITLRARAAVLTKQIEKSLEGGITNPGSGEGYAPEGQYTIGFAVSQNLAKELADIEMQIDAITKKWQKGGSGGSGGGGKGGASALLPQYSVAGLTEDLKYLQQEQQKATSPEEWRTYADAIRAVGDEIKKVKGELSSLGTDNTTGGISISGILSAQIQKDEAAFRNKKINVTIHAEKEKVDTTQKVGELVGGVSSIVSSLNQLGVEIPKGFSNVLSGMQVVITILEAIQTIQTVGSILGIFHNGGIVPHAASGYMVPGTHYSNDVTPVLANAGELILSKSQQGNLAAQLSGTQGGYAAQPYVNGEMILLGTNNHLRRSGQGEIVTTKMLKSMGLIN